jgi:TetR/AcrR family transcriptional regulator, transcriptional repressor for nem operon
MIRASTREQIVDAADELFYRRGFEQTSFAHIAEAVGISRGNFYHHFKSKDAILDAVIAARLTKTRVMLDGWENAARLPQDRILSFVRILVVNQSKILRYGCPVGTLCTELAKLGHPAQGAASELFSLFRLWLARQFELLGRRQDADVLATHVLARSQGIATLANAFHDEVFVKNEVKLLEQWLEQQTPKEKVNVRRKSEVLG